MKPLQDTLYEVVLVDGRPNIPQNHILSVLNSSSRSTDAKGI